MVMGIANGGEWSGAAAAAAKACDSCRAAAAAVFCRVDTAFLCLSCDARIHSTSNRLASSRHERVWMCEVCEQAPAAVTCKADAAALCVSCDADIHSANPLAQRHDRVPVEPFFDSADSIVRSSAAINFFTSTAASGGACNNDSPDDGACHHRHDDVVVETSPWIISNANKLNIDGPDMKSAGEIFFSEMDSFLDFDYPNNSIHGTDSVVPVKIKPISPSPMINHPENCFDIDFCRSKLSSFTNYPPQCLSHSVSSPSLDVGVVPDGNSISEISYPFGSLSHTGGGDPIPSEPVSSTSTSTTSQATQLCGMDREARVLRYREKRKNRKFEKTIRYASRKAYAETRPRIKGRFAKRTEIEIDADMDAEQIFGGGGAAFFTAADCQYGVVPSA